LPRRVGSASSLVGCFFSWHAVLYDPSESPLLDDHGGVAGNRQCVASALATRCTAMLAAGAP